MCYCYLAVQGVIFLQPLEMPVEIPEDSNDSEDDMKLVLASRKGKLKSATFESRGMFVSLITFVIYFLPILAPADE